MPRIAATTVDEHRRVRRQQIIDAVLALLRSGDQLTMASIADTAGLPRSTVYEYFASTSQAIRQARAYRDEPLRLLAERALRHPADVTRDDVARILATMQADEAQTLADYIWAILTTRTTSDPALAIDAAIRIAWLGVEERRHLSEDS